MAGHYYNAVRERPVVNIKQIMAAFNIVILTAYYQRSCTENLTSLYGYEHYNTLAMLRDFSQGEG
jgi:hypothetical protein